MLFKRGIFMVCFCALTLMCTACTNAFSSMAGEWGQFSYDKDMVSAVEPGMRQTQVIERIGSPKNVTNGEMVYAGWAVWTYPSGTITLYRGVVKFVKVNPMSEEELLAIRETHQDYLDFIMNGGKNKDEKAKSEENLDLDDDELRKPGDDLWDVEPYIKKEYSKSEPMTEGMME